MRLKPALQEAAGKVSKVDEPKILVILVDGAHTRERVLDVARQGGAVVLAGQDEGQLRAVGEDLSEVLVAAIIGDGVEGVQQGFPARGVLQVFHEGVVAHAVVENHVPLAAVDQPLDVRNRLPRHADQRVDVALLRELDRVRAHGRRRAVDDDRDRLRRWRPGLWESEAEIQTDCDVMAARGMAAASAERVSKLDTGRCL